MKNAYKNKLYGIRYLSVLFISAKMCHRGYATTYIITYSNSNGSHIWAKCEGTMTQIKILLSTLLSRGDKIKESYVITVLYTSLSSRYFLFCDMMKITQISATVTSYWCHQRCRPIWARGTWVHLIIYFPSSRNNLLSQPTHFSVFYFVIIFYIFETNYILFMFMFIKINLF